MIGFDTLKAAMRLQDEAGFDERQARALVTTFAEGIGEDMATREGLEKTEATLRADIVSLQSDTQKMEMRRYAGRLRPCGVTWRR